MDWKSAILGGGQRERLWHDADKRVHLRQYYAYLAGVSYPEKTQTLT